MANTKKYVSLDKLEISDEKIKGVISAGDDATLTSAKSYADGLAVNYESAGAAATALSEAKSYADGKDAAIQAAQKAADDAAAAAGVADGKAVAAQGEIDALETYVGTIPEGATATNVVAYIQEKTTGIASEGAMTELGNRVTQAEKDIDAIEADYLKAADKTELEGKITAVEGAVSTAKDRAEGKEAELAAAIKAISDDYLKGSDKTELQGNIDTLAGVVETLSEGIDTDKVDGVKDLIAYVEEHGPEVKGMQEDIAGNAEAISGVAGRVETLEGEMDAVEGAVATKAEKTYVDEQVQALQGADTGLGNRITELENKFKGEGSVEDMIADAKQEAIDTAASAADAKDEVVLAAAKKYADDEDAKIEERVGALETASATHALASDLTALDGRVTTAEGEIDTLQSEMDAVEALAAANKAAHEANAAAIALKAAQADLESVSGRVTALETWHNNFTEVSEEEINALFA